MKPYRLRQHFGKRWRGIGRPYHDKTFGCLCRRSTGLSPTRYAAVMQAARWLKAIKTGICHRVVTKGSPFCTASVACFSCGWRGHGKDLFDARERALHDRNKPWQTSKCLEHKRCYSYHCPRCSLPGSLLDGRRVKATRTLIQALHDYRHGCGTEILGDLWEGKK